MIHPQKNELKTAGLVLRRTNYGEADRILNIITPEGKVAVMAKGVRRPKSRLAGGVEIFTLSDYVMHFGKGELGIMTSSAMRKYYGKIMTDFDRMNVASGMLKKVDRASESSDAPEYFEILRNCLETLDAGVDTRLVEAWFELNLLKVMGEEPNFYRDREGARLEATKRYDWSGAEEAFVERENGRYGADEIKILRLMVTTGAEMVARVKNVHEKMPDIALLIKNMVK